MRKTYFAVPALLTVLAATAPAASAQNAALVWNETAVSTVVGAGKFQPEGFVYLAYVQAAVYDATEAIAHRYHPYAVWVRAPRGASMDAAVAAAAHTTLVRLFPADQASLDAAYATSLAQIPDGTSKRDGLAVGSSVATALLALRADDGLAANVAYTFGVGPGLWQLTPDSPATAPQTPWLGQMRPFLLRSSSQFRPGPPPALTSRTYARDLNEIEAFGSKTSSVRTPAQTENALFWTYNADAMDNAGFREVAAQQHMDTVDTARALAIGDMITADAAIACFEAKYHYSFWRPITAIRAADTDGNPATTPDPAWTPLVVTPNHPEYPAAHTCLSAAEAEVYAALRHSRRINIDLTSAVTGTTHHLATVRQMVSQVANARVWAGLHYRNSTGAGARLGSSVADWILARTFHRIHHHRHAR
jgi:hypothetical protein